jgi:hypothetical protein
LPYICIRTENISRAQSSKFLSRNAPSIIWARICYQLDAAHTYARLQHAVSRGCFGSAVSIDSPETERIPNQFCILPD